MCTTWPTMLFLMVSTFLALTMRWAVVLDYLQLIGELINKLINILFQLINWCSPSTSHRTPLGPESGGPTLHTHAGGITRQSSSARRHDTNGKYFQKIFTILTRKYFSFHNHLLRVDGDQRHEHLRHDGARTPRELGGDVLQVRYKNKNKNKN